MSTLRNSGSSVAIVLGLLLLSFPIAGLLSTPEMPEHGTTAELDAIPGYDFAVLNKHCLNDLLSKKSTPSKIDVAEWTDQVFLSMSHSDGRRVHVTENWLLWSAGHVYEPISHTQRTQRIIAGGAGSCSERCQILKSIVERAGLSCRFVGLKGHVVLEIQTPSGWQIADPDYGVVYPVGLADLQSEEGARLMRVMLSARGFSTQTIDEYVRLFHSADDNVTLSVGSPLSPRLLMFESIADWLVWIIPAVLLIAGAGSLASSSAPLQRMLHRA